jgi:hypothetical protein
LIWFISRWLLLLTSFSARFILKVAFFILRCFLSAPRREYADPWEHSDVSVKWFFSVALTEGKENRTARHSRARGKLLCDRLPGFSTLLRLLDRVKTTDDSAKAAQCDDVSMVKGEHRDLPNRIASCSLSRGERSRARFYFLHNSLKAILPAIDESNRKQEKREQKKLRCDVIAERDSPLLSRRASPIQKNRMIMTT